ncbi:MAG: DUF262 domain-containing HNH endonuclease family protein [Pirellulales bacterium]|nr:DUF262 domain-containing HNH endonuclease family protein [Pirellulales bacterium]
MHNIQPRYLSLSELLLGRLFRIPNYQRAYSWEKQHRFVLFEDLKKLYNKGPDESHFMASIVCLKKEKKKLGADNFEIMEIVDGQQRITTLILMLNALKLNLDNNTKQAKKVSREMCELLVKDEGGDLLLLQTNHDTSHFFENYLISGNFDHPSKAKTIADRNILSAMQECNEFVCDWKRKGNSLIELASLLKNQLYFLLHEVSEAKTVYTVFECLNSRGLDVSWLDRLKSILMGKAYELPNANNEEVIKELHTKWSSIYSIIGLNLGMNSQILRYAATLKSTKRESRVTSETDSVEILKQQSSSAREIRNTAAWLLKICDKCSEIANDKPMACVARINHARLLATAIKLSEFSETQKSELLRVWECVTFRIFGMMQKDSRSKVGDYVRLAWSMINEKLPYRNALTQLLEIGSDYPIQKAAEALANRDCYNKWESELRYFLHEYDRHLESQDGIQSNEENWQSIWRKPAQLSIEHIQPQSSSDDSRKHRLGNLLVIPPRLNSKLQAKVPRKKSKHYRETGLRVAIEVANIVDASGWNGKSIRQRETQLIEWAKIRWSDDA